jgi:hypothetical protein
LRKTSVFLCIVQLSAYKRIIRFLELRHDYRRNIALPLVGLVYVPLKLESNPCTSLRFISIWYTEFTYELRFARDAVVTFSTRFISAVPARRLLA